MSDCACEPDADETTVEKFGVEEPLNALVRCYLEAEDLVSDDEIVERIELTPTELVVHVAD